MKIINSQIMAAAFAFGLPGVALAHATFEVPAAEAGSYYKAVLQVPHGCKGEATLKVRVTIPQGVIAVKPMPKPGWTLETVKGDYASEYELHGRKVTSGVKEVIWSGELPDEYYDQFVFQARLTENLPVDQTLYFPVVQECANGSNEWVQIPAEGQDPHSLESPAPGVAINAGGHHHH